MIDIRLVMIDCSAGTPDTSPGHVTITDRVENGRREAATSPLPGPAFQRQTLRLLEAHGQIHRSWKQGED